MEDKNIKNIEKEYEKTIENLECQNPFQTLTKAIIKGEEK